ncbi:stage VI sporulation protein D [Niallia oryzisoli]|uniref:Stage VI sporulation protein D n=1 Tax=Niallia oryzisoli TaxID=1737571 RepID=A0ABZ2CHG1_9BACI
MSHGNQSYLRFSLEESVWFQKGQEVDELVSISLDPIITIKESDQYVTIKGSLELSGEYNREQTDEDEMDYFTNPKLIQTVEVREEGVHLFSHHFPVEITIPKNRIEALNDIQVTVETFDYAFPEKSCLRLSADLMITGLYGEQQHELVQEQHEYETYEFEPQYRESAIPEEEYSERKNPFAKPQFADEESSEVYKPFEVEARKDPEAEVQYDNQTEEFEQEEADLDKDNQSEYLFQRKDVNSPVNIKPNLEEVPGQEVVNRDEDVHAEISEPEQAAFPEIVFSAKRSEETQQVPVSEKQTVKKVVELQEENVQPMELEEMMSELEEESSSSSSSSSDEPPQKKKGKKLKNKQSLTLSEFFARKAEEEHTRVTMCIVQNGETLDTISERYDVPAAQIQRVNHMELNQDIYEGQVLYIPIAQTQR